MSNPAEPDPAESAEPGPADAVPGPDGDPSDLLDALAETAFTVTAVLAGIGASRDLSLTQVRMLGVLRDRRVRMADLADHLGLERSTLSGLVDRAERRGLVGRERSRTDGRAFEVTMTDDGRRQAAEAFSDLARHLGPGIEHLGADQRAQLTALLRTFLGHRA